MSYAGHDQSRTVYAFGTGSEMVDLYHVLTTTEINTNS
mgnify:CR=1 FL=1